jgi:hypothetical protein
MAIAINPTTRRLICSSFNPCITARLPMVRASRLNRASTVTSQRNTRSQSRVLAIARAKRRPKKYF